MSRNCYLVLGVDRSANPSQIRRAFRRLAHQVHPDHAGESATERFVALKQAYETLIDSALRSEHDRALQLDEQVRRSVPPAVVPRPVHIFDSFHSFNPRREVIQDVLERNFRRVPKSQPVHEVRMDVRLTPAQALRGGALPLEVPVGRLCERCDGSGVTGFYTCHACDGHGMLWDLARVDVLLQPPVRDGTIVPVSLRHIGVRNMHLSVHVHVGAR